MKFYGKAQTAAQQILDAFREGRIPQALAHVFIQRTDDVPCRHWSWNNQLITALMGHSDARGFRQWRQVGRHVKKGERGFPILCPIIKKREKDNGEEDTFLVGFKHAIVFGLSQTEGDPLPRDTEVERFLDSLPLREVAQQWGITVEAFNGEGAGHLGYYRPDGHIALGVRNLATWAHELVHAADHRRQGALKGGQQLDQEIVAEVGSAVLLELLGHQRDADRGGCWEYIQSYAAQHGVEPITVCARLLNRTCEAVALILETAEAQAGMPQGAVA